MYTVNFESGKNAKGEIWVNFSLDIEGEYNYSVFLSDFSYKDTISRITKNIDYTVWLKTKFFDSFEDANTYQQMLLEEAVRLNNL